MTTILVWNNRKVHLGGHTYMGHAAMNIDDQWHWGLATRHSYVSFWPSSEAKVVGPSVSSTHNVSIGTDIEAEGYAPDHILRLSGLDIGAMKSEWRQTQGSLKDYSGLRNNCSSVVATVLKKGSAGGSFRRRHSAIWTPLNVKRLALDMGATTLTWTRLLAELSAAKAFTIAEAQVLNELGKRDERHGSSTTSAYFANGRRVMDKQRFSTDRVNGGFNFTGGGNAVTGSAQIGSLRAVSGGTLFQEGMVTRSIDSEID